jgi:hypothetical protein
MQSASRMVEGNPPLLESHNSRSAIHDPMASYMNRLPTAWVIPDPDVKLIKRGNVYYSQPVAEKPAKQSQSRSKTPKSPKKPS